MNYYLDVLKKYAVFDGRARRKEYWMFILCNLIVTIVLSIVFNLIGLHSLIIPLYGLAVLLRNIGVGVKKAARDTVHGWWLLIGLIPLIGAIILLIFFVIDSQPGSNQYSPRRGCKVLRPRIS